MHVIVAGLRGFPDIQGGIETHCMYLYPCLIERGAQVDVIVRPRYYTNGLPESWRGVRFIPLFSPASTRLETIVHTLLATLYAAWKRPDIFHLHAVGPGIWVPLARLLGLRVVMTHHGPDYDREKWGWFARTTLMLGERFGMQWASARIVISKTIDRLVQSKYGRNSYLIPNGVPAVEPVAGHAWLDSQGVVPGKYVLQVSRLVREKRQTDLIQAFVASGIATQGWRLLIVGALDGNDAYEDEVQAAAQAHQEILLTGFQTGAELAEIFTHCGAFVLPSSHEGLPIALLEALSYGLRVFASDIPANLEVEINRDQFYPVADVGALTELLESVVEKPWSATERTAALTIAKTYDWDLIADLTEGVYRELLPISP